MNASFLLRDAEPRLAAVGIPTARLDAELLLAHVLGCSRTMVFAGLHDEVPAAAAAQFEALVQRRELREPVAYLTGAREFWGLRLMVTPEVLVPRPETEMLIELVLDSQSPDACATLPASARRPLEQPFTKRPPRGFQVPQGAEILDVGTGSGCLAIALAFIFPTARVTAVDVSPAALALARRNAVAQRLDARVTFVESDLFAALPADATYDLIVANPPYLAPGDAISPELAFEPQEALYAGADGLAVIRRLLAAAPARLRPRGRLVMEFGGMGQRDVVLALALASGFPVARAYFDMAAIPRIMVADVTA